jgi:hypothetical protein
MPKDMHQKAAEHHEQAAKAHRTAAEQHGSNDHVSAKQQSAQAADKSKAAHASSGSPVEAAFQFEFNAEIEVRRTHDGD